MASQPATRVQNRHPPDIPDRWNRLPQPGWPPHLERLFFSAGGRGQFSRDVGISHHVEDVIRVLVARRAAAAGASLNRWRGMFRRAKRRRSSGIVSKSASMKISTVSSMNPDTNRCVAKVYLVASSVLSSNDGVGHCGLFVRDRRQYHGRMVPEGSRKRCMKTRSSQRPNLCPTSLK